MKYPLVLDLAAGGVPVAVACRVLGFSAQAFYGWKKSPVRRRDWDDAHLIHAAIGIHRDDPGPEPGAGECGWEMPRAPGISQAGTYSRPSVAAVRTVSRSSTATR